MEGSDQVLKPGVRYMICHLVFLFDASDLSFGMRHDLLYHPNHLLHGQNFPEHIVG
ncbi:MAG: hypothetical protein BWY82_02709 [Verrucomicrobia bacterium ADurb.Bin474]|nr:MAG: hypothetical protein BWY82_02709 [Verrucomicrobia bacterium ADurb.Bin474]